jgi:hypothetical protein
MLRTALCLLAGLLVALAAAPPAAAAGCEGDGDCKAGRVCLSGKCAAKPKSCSKDSECPGDLVCEQTRCVLPPGDTGAATPAPARSSPATPQQSRTTAPQVMDLELPPLVAGPGAVSAQQPPAAGQGLRPVYTKETWPLSLIDRPLVLAKGMFEGTVLLDKSLSSGLYDHLGAGLAAYYGVDEKLTAGVSHLSFCLTGCAGTDFFHALSFDARYLYYSDAGVNVAPEASLFFQALSPFTAVLGAGVEVAYKLGPKMTLWVNPHLTLGVVGRGNSPSPDLLSVAVQPRYALTDQLTLVPAIAVDLPFEATGAWVVPFGAGVHYALTRQADVGADFTLGTLIPHGGFGIFDSRALHAFLTVRL